MSKYIRIISNIIFGILTTILIIFTTIAIYSFINIKLLNKEYANIFGYTFFEVATGSMADTINVGDIVIIDIGSNFEVGDVITYKDGNDFITHRVIKKDNNSVITKGDANNSEDQPISYKNIIGKVTTTIEKVGIWKKVLLTPKVLISLTVTIGLFLIYRSQGKDDDNETKA